MRALPKEIRNEAPIYPRNVVLSYADLAKMVRYLTLESEPFVSKPFALLAESFSTPLAMRIAAERPPNLKGLILCAGFAASPIRGPLRWFARLTASVLFRIRPPEFVIRSRLVGEKAPLSLVEAVRAAVCSVEPQVLAARLRAVLTCNVRSDLTTISVPILYLRAKHDRVVKPDCLEEMCRLRGDIRVAEVDGPHLLLQREPQKTAEIVANLLRELG